MKHPGRKFALALSFCLAVPLGWLLLVGLTGCTPALNQEINPSTFDARRAYNHVRALVNLGPRPASSAALAKAASYIIAQLDEAGVAAQEQVFIAASPRGPLQFRNVVGRTRARAGTGRDIIIIGSHYDTKWMTNLTFVGANDGGSSSGALLEIARCAAAQPDIWFVFFDGEEAIVEYTEEDGLVGSKFFVRQLQAEGLASRVRAVIIIDMIGDTNLRVAIPANTDGKLTELTFEAARDLGYRDFFALNPQPIVDDHVPFVRAGIPAVNLIDFEFGSAPGLNDYWHTEKDTLDKVSPRSLEIVGQTVLRLVAKLRAGPVVR